jgi:hypothetical protein
MSNFEKSILGESNEEFNTGSPYALNMADSRSNIQEVDPNRSVPVVKSPMKRMAVGRKLQDFDPNLSGSMDFSGESKQTIPHHRVDDLSRMEECYEIGKKLGE